MREPPALAPDAIAAALQAGFGIRVAQLEFLAVGNDAASWAFRVGAPDGKAWFLKVRAGHGRWPGSAVPWHLHRLGVPHVLAPLATTAGVPYVEVDGFALALYPMLDARPAVEVGLSAEQWRTLGDVVRQVHAVPPTPDLTRMVARETFRPAGRDVAAGLEALLATAPPEDGVARELAAFWRPHREVVRALVDRADVMGRQLRRSAAPQVLCHGDLHTWNLLVDAVGWLWVVDWDEAVLAPKERDLMFVVGGIRRGLVAPRETGCFFQGYGEASVDQRLLAYYRCAWAVQDIAAYAEQVLLSPGLGEESRRAALDGFKELFEPGHIVELATVAD
jgi:spectinomycin phosphotransferase